MRQHVKRAFGLAAAAVGVAALAIPAAASVRPQSGHYRMAKPGDTTADVVSFELKGSKLYSFTHYDRCVTDVVDGRFVTKVKGGTFSFHQIVKATPAAYRVDLTGRFVSATKATGTVTYKKVKGSSTGPKGCHTTTRFTVLRSGPPRPPNFADR